MWIVIYKEHLKIAPELVGRVFAIENTQPLDGAYPTAKFEIKEWGGSPPSLGNPQTGELPDLDPTLDDPDYADYQEARTRFDELAEQASSEIAWLEKTIPQIETMTLEELRGVLKRLAQENLRCIRAWRYVIRRLL